MTKKVLVISSTLRLNGNSETLAMEFAKGAKEKGNDVKFISLKDKEIKFCKGCLACQKTGNCIIKDDSLEIVENMKNTDVIVFATPIYYYEMSGQLKTLLDRANSLFASNYKFREIYFISTAADTNPHSADIAINGIRGWISCFSGVKLKGTLLGAGAENAGDIKTMPALKQAYELGKTI